MIFEHSNIIFYRDVLMNAIVRLFLLFRLGGPKESFIVFLLYVPFFIALFADSVVQRSPRMSGAKADAELRSKTDNLERMITEVMWVMFMIKDLFFD